MARKTPKVHDNRLFPVASGTIDGQEIGVGSVEWYHWLEKHSAFVFEGTNGNFTARREQRSGNDYWYAYRKHDGKLHKLYLGRGANLTLDRLNDTASHMAALIAGFASAVTFGNAVKHDETPLSTKFIPPYVVRTLVARARLYEKLDRAVQQRLTLVSAAPGFGKTTLLAAWCAGHPERRAAWVTLDSRDNDPIRFWRSSIIALDKTYPGLGAMPLALMNSSTAPHSVSIETVLVALINAIVASEGEVILILDDYQVIHAQAMHDTLSFLLEHASSSLHVIIGSRVDPPLPLMRLRAKGQLVEIRASDLQFDSGETSQFLKETMGLPLSTAQVETLHRRTEGWITGLLLAALSIPDSPDIATFLDSFSGMDRYIFDYLVSELLEQQPSEMQQFLLQTSVLDRLCAPLAEALTGYPNAQSVLEHLERANLFLVPLDNQRRWYRYHPLFADVLKARLTQQFLTQVTDLHQRAALWYASQGFHDEAIAHALAGHAIDAAADLMAQSAPSMLRRGELASLLHWLTLIPDEVVIARPSLGLSLAAALLAVGRLEETAQHVNAIERAIESRLQQERVSDWHGEIAALHMTLALVEGQTPEMLRQARLAQQLLPPHDVFMRGFVSWALAGAQFLTDGDVVEALRAFDQVLSVNRAAGNLIMVLMALYSRATLETLNGQLHQAAQTCRESIQLIKIDHAPSLPMAALGYVGLGDLLREWNRLEDAHLRLTEGLQLGQAWTAPEFLVDGYIAFARLQQAQGKGREALASLDEIDTAMRKLRVSRGNLEVVAAHRVRLWLRQGNLQAAQGWAKQMTESDANGQRTVVSAWLSEIEGITLARVFLAEGHSPQALLLLDRLASKAEAAGRITSLIEIVILQALALKATGRMRDALSRLKQALHLAQPERYVRLFADEGLPLAELLRTLSTQIDDSSTRGYLEQLVAVIEKDATSPNRRLPEPLTEREREILRLVAAGYSNHEIAARLVLGVSTVKWHVSNLLSKLNTYNRAQAVHRAQELGFL